MVDGDGDGSARRDLGAFELPAVPDAGQPGGQAPAGVAGTTAATRAPLVSGFRATPARFVVARLRSGTRFRYTLSEPARVALEIQRRGRRGYRTVATLRRTAASGSNRMRFTGRIGRRALRPGRCRATLRATDAAGNRSLPRTARFRITGG